MDIVDLSTRSNMSKNGTAMQFVEIFEPQLTTAELAAIARFDHSFFELFL